MGKTIWENPNVLTANNVAKGMQGRFRWRAFAFFKYTFPF